MIKSETKEIDDGTGVRFTFHVNQLPALSSLHMKARVLKIMGPALSNLIKAISGKDAKKKLLDNDLEAFAPIIESIAGNLEPEVFSSLCMDFMKGVVVTGDNQKFEPANAADFDRLFTGRLGMIYRAIFFVLQVNDFFGLGAIGKALAAGAKAPPKVESNGVKAP